MSSRLDHPSEHVPKNIIASIRMGGPRTTVVVKGPTSYQRLFNRLPHLGQASAVRLTSYPQSLQSVKRANFAPPRKCSDATSASGRQPSCYRRTGDWRPACLAAVPSADKQYLLVSYDRHWLTCPSFWNNDWRKAPFGNG
jgi:hypothetical protein